MTLEAIVCAVAHIAEHGAIFADNPDYCVACKRAQEAIVQAVAFRARSTKTQG